MATYRQIFTQDLAADVAEKAIRNTDNLNNTFGSDSESPTLGSKALSHAFSWSSSPERHDYWEGIHMELETNELLNQE